MKRRHALGFVALILGVIYGSSVSTAFAPGAEILAGAVTGFCSAGFALLFWGILGFIPEQEGLWRMARAAVAMLLAVPASVFVASGLVLTLLDPGTSWGNPGAVAELSLFMVRFTVVHLGIMTLPIAALAGAAAVAR